MRYFVLQAFSWTDHEMSGQVLISNISNTAKIKMQAADLKHRSQVTGQVRSYGHCHDLFNLYLSLFH